MEARRCRCCGHGTGRSDLGGVCRLLEARGCHCSGSGSGRLDLGASCGWRDAPRLVGRAVRQEVWEYDGGEWPHRRCSMECHGDWEELEEDECVLGEWEVPDRLRLSTRRWEEDDDDRCRDCLRRKGVESNYYDEDEYDGRRREMGDVNERHRRFRDSDRRWKQRDYHDNEDDLDLRRRRDRREGRERRDFELQDAVDMRRVEARRYGEDDRKYDRRRERSNFDFDDAADVKRVGASRYTVDDRRFDQRTERRDFEIDDEVDVRREGRRRGNDDQRYVTWHQRRNEDREGEDVSLLGSRRWHDQEYDYDDQYIAEQRHHSGGRSQKSARVSALHEDDSKRASSSRNAVDTRLARKDENSASRVRWHDNVDRRAEQTSEERDRRYSSSVGQSNDEKDEYDYDDARLVRVRDYRTGTKDVRVIPEDDTSLASSSKTTSILKHRSNVDWQVAARKDESRNSTQKIMEISEVRANNTERDSRTQSYHQEDGREHIENRSSSLQGSVKMVSDSRRQIDQHDEVDQQVVALTDSRKKSEKLTDIAIDSSRNVSRAFHSQRNYDEVNQTDIDDRSTSVHNITHVTRDKKRYVNQQVIHETDIDVQNVTHVDVSKVGARDISVSRSSQNHSETRSDVNSTSNVSFIDRAKAQQEQIHQNKVCASDSAMVRGSKNHLETVVYDRVHSTKVTNVVDSTKERQEQVELTKARTNNASTSAVNTIGSVKEQIDLTKIHASDTTVVSSSQGLDTRWDNQAYRTSSVNLVDRARESRDNSDLQMTQSSSIERNDQVRTKFSESSQDSRERLARLEETERLMQQNMDLNWQQAGTTSTSDDKETTNLQMDSTEDGSSMVNTDLAQRGTVMGSSEQQIKSETTAGSIPSSSSARQSVKESLLESAARLEKSSTFHVGQFVDEVQKGVADADTTLAKENEKSVMEGIKRSTSRSRMRGPSDEMWDVQSATSQETFKTADKEEGSSADGATNSASQTPKTETALARKVHKSLWGYVADIVRLGWIQRGESHDSSNKSVKKSSSSNSQSTKGWLSSQECDNDSIRKKNGSITPRDQQLMKSHTGESEARVASTPKEESWHTGTQCLQISEANNVPQVGRSKGDFVARSSKDDVHVSGERTKQSYVGALPKGNIIEGFAEDGTPTSVDVTIGHLPEHEAATSSSITTKGSAESITGKGVFADTTSMTINTEEAGRNCDADDWRCDPSGATTPYHHPQTQAMMPHQNTLAATLGSPELPTGGSTRFEEKIVIQEPPEVMRAEGKDAELKRRKFQRNKQVLKETFDEWEEAYQRDVEQRKTDELFMREALHEAQRAAEIWEVPVGAVLVQNGEIIARGSNLVEDLRDSTAHAEIVCIREASNKLKTWRLADTTLYVTLEPCAMCAGAILQARVDTVVWGAPNKLLGADGSWVRLFPGDGQTSTVDSANQSQTSGPVHPFHPNITIRRGVLSNECSEIMQQFFHLRRKKKQKPESPPHARIPGHNHPFKFFTKMHNMFGTIFCM